LQIDGASRKTVHKGRWDKVYEICLNSLAALEDIAMKRRRNFILDQVKHKQLFHTHPKQNTSPQTKDNTMNER